LLQLNEALRRSVIRRWARGRARWSTIDGLIQVTPATARALERNRLTRRPYSLSALQRFSSCPYQFLLAAIHRIEPWEEPQPILRMDPLTRGSLFHRIQAEFFREMQRVGGLPVRPDGVRQAIGTLHGIVDRVAAEYADALVPAIARVWRDEIDDLRRDLAIWVQRLAEEKDWIPEYFEFSFGLSDEGRDPRSVKDPVTIEGGFILRGSVDVIERQAKGGALRVTDHKTGKNRTTRDLVIGGGGTLQPVLYSVAVEAALGAPVTEGRLYYCTTAGGFTAHSIPVNASTRKQGLEVLAIIDRAVELGRLPAAPLKDACRWCDFRAICGPDEEARANGKSEDLIADLLSLREAR
jgi:ATP-dependent helicase/DNAse subunit B